MIGLDLASVDGNGHVGMSPAKAAGIRFVISRASYGYWDKSHRAWVITADRAHVGNMQAARMDDLLVGAYMFPIPGASQTPEEQVVVFRDAVNAAGGIDFPPILDIEFPGGVKSTGHDRAELLAWIVRAVVAVRAAFGVSPMLYTSARVLDGEDDDSLNLDTASHPELSDCTLWLARYPFKTRIPAVLHEPSGAPPTPAEGAGWWIWQYQGDALGVPGFTATVDLNKFNVTRLGDRGAHVAWLQRRLGMAEGTPGVFDDATEAAVRVHQAANGLSVDGVVGPATFARIAWS